MAGEEDEVLFRIQQFLGSDDSSSSSSSSSSSTSSAAASSSAFLLDSSSPSSSPSSSAAFVPLSKVPIIPLKKNVRETLNSTPHEKILMKVILYLFFI